MLPLASVLGAHQLDARVVWTGSLPAAAVADDGVETVN
jgi:hypothetical protein